MNKSKIRLNVQKAFIIIFLYLIFEVVMNLILRIFVGVSSPTDQKTIIAGVIGNGMTVNIIVSVLLVFITIFIFRKDTKDIFFERQPFSLSKVYYVFPLIWTLVGVTALLMTNLAQYRFSTILLVILASLSIAINEEILTRGILLTSLRKKGMAEWAVFLITTLVFALLHLVNVLGGGPITQVLVTVFGGVLLYISRRVFNNLFVPILLHAFYDTALYLQTGFYLENQTLADNIQDFNLASFLIMTITVIVFLIFGRKLLKVDNKIISKE